MPSRRYFDVIEFKQWMGNFVLDVIAGGRLYFAISTKVAAPWA